MSGVNDSNSVDNTTYFVNDTLKDFKLEADDTFAEKVNEVFDMSMSDVPVPEDYIDGERFMFDKKGSFVLEDDGETPSWLKVNTI